MKRMLLAVGVGLVLCCPWALAGDKEFAYIDLQPKANHKLTDPFHSGSEGNDLSDLPKGEQVFAKVKFKVGDGLIQLGSKRTKDLPDMVEGIEVNRSFVRLHLLHATGYGAYGNEGDELFVADDTPIGEYVDSPQNRSSCFVNFIEEPERLPFRYLFLGPSPAIVVVDDRVAHGFTPADPLMQ